MNWIDPEDVIKAYEETGMTPGIGAFFLGEGKRGCAGGALLNHAGITNFRETTPEKWFDLLYEVEPVSFGLGFDEAYECGDVKSPAAKGYFSPARRNGYEVGLRVRERFHPDVVQGAAQEQELAHA